MKLHETWLDYIRIKLQQESPSSPPYQPVALGGLWKNETIDDKDMAEVREEMWRSMEKRAL